MRVTLKMNKEKKSPIWKYFEKKSDTLACCTLCKACVKVFKNTTNLWSHLKAWHKNEHSDLLFLNPRGEKRKKNDESNEKKEGNSPL